MGFFPVGRPHHPYRDNPDHDIGIRKKLFHAACRDITLRKQIEAELRMSEEKYRTIFETSGTAMIIFDDSMTIILMNRGMEHLTGYSRNEIEGKRKWTDFVQEEELDMLMKYQNRSMKDPKSAPLQVEFSYINKSGEVRECIGNFSIIAVNQLHVGSSGHHESAGDERNPSDQRLKAQR
jgi:PAS domain S-box-containing protein